VCAICVCRMLYNYTEPVYWLKGKLDTRCSSRRTLNYFRRREHSATWTMMKSQGCRHGLDYVVDMSVSVLPQAFLGLEQKRWLCGKKWSYSLLVCLRRHLLFSTLILKWSSVNLPYNSQWLLMVCHSNVRLSINQSINQFIFSHVSLNDAPKHSTSKGTLIFFCAEA